MESLESRQMLANIVWDGGAAGTGTDFNLAANWVGDVLPGAADIAVINTAGATITVGASRAVTAVESSRVLQLNSGTLTTTGTSAMTASLTMNGGTLAGGTWNFSGLGNVVRSTSSGGSLSGVVIGGELVLDTTSATILVSGITTFTAARLTANATTLQMAPGFTLNSLVSVEGATAGTRGITLAVGGAGTVTIGPSGIIRLASNSGGGLNISNSSAATLVNNGLISAEAPAQTLSINNSTFTNSGIAQVTAGTLNISPTNWTNTGTVNATGGGLVLLSGIFNATAGIGTFTTAAGTVRITSTITNTGNTIALNAATGSWVMFGGTINNGSISYADGSVLRFTTSGGTLSSVAIAGDLLLDSTSASVLLSGTTSFVAARLIANATTLQMAPGYTLSSLVVAEGAAAGTRTISLAVGGAGTVTFAPGSIVRLDATSGGNLSLSNSSAATLINNGLITAEASSRVLTISNSTFTNNNSAVVTAGTLAISPTNFTNVGAITANGAVLTIDGTWTDPGTISVTNSTLNLNGVFNSATFNIAGLSRTGGTVNLGGVLTNTGSTLALTAATGSWNLFGGTINNGSVTLAGGSVLRATTSGGTLNGVALAGDLVLDSTSASVLLSGNTTFAAARLTASGTVVQMAPGYTLNSLVVAEGANTGTRSIQLAVGGTGTVTFGPSAIVRLATGTAGAFNISNSSAATLINHGLITAEANGQILTINNSTFTNNGTAQVVAGTLSISPTNWTNPGTVNGLGGIVNLDGAFNVTGGIGTFTASAATVRVTGTVTNTGGTIALNAATGSWTMFGGTILNGSMTFAGGAALRTTSSSGTLSSVALGGEILLDTTSASILLVGSTTFTAARMSANAVNVQMAPGYTLNSLVVAEGATAGTRTINLAVGGTGTVTFGPSAVVRHAAGTAGAFNISNSSNATLVNNGLITAEASGQILTINNSVLTNNGTLQVIAGTMTVNATNWTNPGIVNGTGGTMQLDGTLNATGGLGTMTTAGSTVRVAGVITNTGGNIALNATTGSWFMFGGNIVNGSMTFTGGTALRTTTSGGTLTSVAIAGELLLDISSASVLLAGNTSFTAARLTASGTALQMAPGYTLNSLVVAEGATVGTRTIHLAVGGTGTVTFGPLAIVRHAAGTAGAFNMSNSSTATLINNGLISAEATGQIFTMNHSALTNNGTLQVTAGTLTINVTNWTNAGTINGTGGIVQLDGTLNATAGIGTFTTSAAFVRVGGIITNTGNTIALTAATGSWNMFGGNIVNGAMTFAGGTALRTTNSGGALSSVALAGELLLDTASASVVLAGNTSFTAARMTASGTNLQMAPGYTLNNLVVAEGAAVGTRTIQLALGGTGTVTFGPSAIVRLAAGVGGALNMSNSSVATLINNGLISAEATGQILTINNSAFTNNGTAQAVLGGSLNLSNTFTNTGLLAGVTGNLNITGTLNNVGATQTISAAAGNWRLLGGNINGGTVVIAGGVLVPTTSGGNLNNVAVSGEILFSTVSSTMLMSGTTTFGAVRLLASGVGLQLAPGYTLNDLVVAEGAAAGTRTIQLAVGGTGTVTFAATAVVRHAAGVGGALNISNSSVATLINNGLISAEATGQILTINNSVLNNSGTAQAITGGTLTLSGTFTNTGLLAGVGGDLNFSGTFNNIGFTQTVNAAAGVWRLTGGTINGGIINVTDGVLRGTNSAGVLSNVAVNGDFRLDTTSAAVRYDGSTNVTTTRLAANNVTLQLPPGTLFNSTVLVEGAASGTRNISLAVGGSGTVTFGPLAVVRVMSGSGGGLNISNSSVATLLNNGLISSESIGQLLTINPTTFTNNNILRTANGGRMSVNQNSWSNAATLDIQSGDLTISGSGAFTNSGVINLGGTITVPTSAGLVLTSSSVVNATISGTATSAYGRIVVSSFDATLAGTLNIAFAGAYQPPIVSTFDIVTVNQPARSIIGGFSTTVMPPPGVDGKNFMFNDSRHIIFAFSSLADYNSDTIVDFFDYLDFVNDFSNQTGGADFNLDGVIDFFDYLDFLVIFSRF